MIVEWTFLFERNKSQFLAEKRFVNDILKFN